MSQPLQEIVVLFGQPVAGNPTQYMLEKAFAQAGLDWRYLTLEISPDNLADALRGFRAMGFQGANVTTPHNISVLPLLDELTDAARLIGAINFIQRVQDKQGYKLRGDNTDGKGFLTSLKEVVDPVGKNIVVLGAGGAARAIAVEIGLLKPAKMTIVNRSPEHAQSLVQLLQNELQIPTELVLWKGTYEVPNDTDVVINATSIGMQNPQAPFPVSFAHARPELVAADVVFSSPDTRFLQEARAKGCRTLDGLSMMVNQGVLCFQAWTGVNPDIVLMREALEEFVSI